MRVLVTGISGFVGGAVAAALVKKGHDVTGLVRRKHSPAERMFEVVIGDCASNNFPDLRKGRFDAVVHCAGLAHQPFGTEEKRFFDVNVTGTANIAAEARDANIKQFIHISSVSVYGNVGYIGFCDESASCTPRDAYARSKLASEQILQSTLQGSQTKAVILRPATVVGEGDRGNIARLIELLSERWFITIGKGENLKSFIYIGDLAAVVAAVLIDKGFKKPVYNVTARPITVNKVLSTICEELGRKEPVIHLPAAPVELAFNALSRLFPVKFMKRLNDSVEKWLREDSYYGEALAVIFKPRIRAEEALRREVRWYRARK